MKSIDKKQQKQTAPSNKNKFKNLPLLMKTGVPLTLVILIFYSTKPMEKEKC